MSRGRFNTCGYKERHHIVPRCLGGKDNKENLIDLYPKEHFIAHKLLAEENQDNDKLWHAWWLMANVKNEQQDRVVASPEEYEILRCKFVDMMSGENNPMFGKFGENNPMFGKHIDTQTKKYLHDINYEGNSAKAKKVIQVETSTVYDSISQASRITNTKANNISACCRGKKKTANGYHWIYASDDLQTKIEQIKTEVQWKSPVYCIELDKKFDSITQASQETGCSRVLITRSCKSNGKNMCRSSITKQELHWNYINPVQKGGKYNENM